MEVKRTHWRVLPLAFVAVSVMAVPAAHAGFLDNLKRNVKSAVTDTVVQTEQNTSAAVNNSINQTVSGAVNSAVSPQNTAAADDAWKTTQTYSDDAANQMQLVEASAQSPSVLDIPLKGIRLGMPMRLVDKTLKAAGFEYVSHQGQYQKEVKNANGELAERYFIKLHAKEVSEAMVNELDAERQAMVDQARAIADQESAQQVQRASEDRRSRTRRRASASTGGYLSNQPVQLVYYIEYRQLYFGDQKFDYQTALQQARQAFGEPSYHGGPQGRMGAAYQTTDEYQLVYLDSLLTPAAEREALVRQADPSQHYVMKLGMSHPCSGIMRGRCANGAHAASAFPGNLEKQLELARLQLAPFMLVTHDTSKGMKVIQEWQYLNGGDTIREQFREKQQEAAKPTATVSF